MKVNKDKNPEEEEVIPPRKTEEESEESEEEEEGDEPEDKSKEESEADEESDDEEEDESEQDIDFEKELDALEAAVPQEERPTAPSAKTEEEKAGYTVAQAIKRLKKKGKTDAEISKIVGFKVTTDDEDEDEDDDSAQQSQFVRRDELDLRDAEKEAGRLARSEAEKKVIMHYVRHNKLSVEQAHLLANRGRITRSAEEIARRGESRPAAPGAAGRRDTVNKKPRFSTEEMATMTRRGMTWNPQTQRMEGKLTFVRIDPKTGERISGRLEKKK